MTRDNGGVVDTSGPLQAALEDHAAVVKLTRELVRIPSRGGIDPYDPVLDYMASWLAEHDPPCRRLAGPGGTTIALTCEITGAGPDVPSGYDRHRPTARLIAGRTVAVCAHPRPHRRSGQGSLPRAHRGSSYRVSLTRLQDSLHAAGWTVAPPEGALDAALQHRAFPPDAGSLLPGLLAATRTGLPPAGGHELARESPQRDHLLVIAVHPRCWAHGTRASVSRRCRSGGSPGTMRPCGPGPARGGRGPRGRTGGCRCRTARARA
jgi:hypothetical protein